MKKEKLKLSLGYCHQIETLEQLIKKLDSLNINKKDYSKLEFGADFSSVYYEGDWPTATLEWKQ